MRGVQRSMNKSELSAWRVLVELGARRTEIGGMQALDVSTIRVTSQRKMSLFAQAFNEVAGRSGANRRHVNRLGSPVYVVTEDFDIVRSRRGQGSEQTIRSDEGKTDL